MTEEELIKDVINYIEDDVNAYDYMIYEDKQEWEDYLKRVFREVKKPLEKKIDKMISVLKEEVGCLTPYEIYHSEVDDIVEKVEQIAKGED